MNIFHIGLSRTERLSIALKTRRSPILLHCADAEDLRLLISEDFTYIDATSILFGELVGTDYEKRDFYEPIWYQDMLKTKLVVLDNFNMIPSRNDELDKAEFSEYDEARPAQGDFLFLCRNVCEGKPYTLLNAGSPYFVPDDVFVIIVVRPSGKYHITEQILRRTSVEIT